MSKRRKIERPAAMTNAPYAGAVAHEQAAEALRRRVFSEEDSGAAATRSGQRPRDLDRAAYNAGSITLGRRDVVVSPEERYAAAMQFAPRMPVLYVVRLRPQAVEPVMRVPFQSIEADTDLISRMFTFARWYSETYGSFDWRSHLTEENIDSFIASTMADWNQRTINTYRSQLRRVLRGEDLPRKSGRKTKAVTPHPAAEWERLWDGANAAGQWTTDAVTHLALTGGAGLRPTEVVYAKGCWVTDSSHGLHIRVPDEAGTFRDVPITGRYADVVRAAARRGSNSYLVMPQLVARRNVSSHLKSKVKQMRSDFAGYDATRARNLWICRLLGSGVPTVVVAYVAGVGSGSSLLADLAAELPQPDLDQVFKYLTLPELTV